MTSVKVEFLGCTYTKAFGKNYHLYIYIKLKKQVMNIKYHNLQSREPQDLTCVTFERPLGLFSLPLQSPPTKMIVVNKLRSRKKKKEKRKNHAV